MSMSVRVSVSLRYGSTPIKYITRSDTSVSGSRFNTRASPSLAHLVREAARDVPHPTREGDTLWDATGDKGTLTGPADPEVIAMAEADAQIVYPNFGVSPLGSGSDFTIFLQRIGVRHIFM